MHIKKKILNKKMQKKENIEKSQNFDYLSFNIVLQVFMFQKIIKTHKFLVKLYISSEY